MIVVSFKDKCIKGFTLIEVIATLLMISVFGTTLFVYFNSSITHSSDPIHQLSEAHDLKQVIENITQSYLSMKPVDLTDLASLKTAIGAENSSQSNNFGTYSVLYNDYIDFNTDGTIKIPANPPTATDNYPLKVTLKGSSGITITILFPKD